MPHAKTHLFPAYHVKDLIESHGKQINLAYVMMDFLTIILLIVHNVHINVPPVKMPLYYVLLALGQIELIMLLIHYAVVFKDFLIME